MRQQMEVDASCFVFFFKPKTAYEVGESAWSSGVCSSGLGNRRIVEENGEKFMLFYGMSSESAMKRHVGGVAEYRAAEGKTVKLPLRGPVENTARDILGGLRSACTYVGASRLKELTKRTTFIRVQEQENRILNNL